MQIYAYDQEGYLIPANQALRHQNYQCLECGRVLRLRGGKWRKLHFYHLDPLNSCHLHGKSLAHLNTQYALQKLLASEQTFLEHRFPEIERIADVVWPAKKRVFEVQCSPISATEIEARNRDYARIGYTVVWILHDRRYNRFSLTPAEHYLRPFPHFFTNINAHGKGIIYNQLAQIQLGKRIHRSARIPVSAHHLLMQSTRQFQPIAVNKRFYFPNFFRLFYLLLLEKLTK